MADRIEIAFRRAAADVLLEPRGVLVAVSGGGDSMALLHLLHRAVRNGRPRLVVAHLDHALRRGSVGDRRFVERAGRRLALPCVAERIDVRRARRRDESLEEAARRVRRDFLRRAAGAHDCAVVALGHTLDDQAETVLMRLVRGAGPAALAAMAARGPRPFVRPLLAFERLDLRAWLEARNLDWREDRSNRDLRFDRNRVRALVVPALVTALHPRAPRRIARAAERLREDAVYLDALAREALEQLRRPDARRFRLDAVALAELPPALAGRVARLALQHAGIDPRRIAESHVRGLVELARGEPGRCSSLPGGQAVKVDADTVELRGPAAKLGS